MAGPVMLFSLLIAVLWAWSPFTHPPTRCTRCTSAAPHLRPWHTRTSGTCPQMRRNRDAWAPGGYGPAHARLGHRAHRRCGGAAHPPPEQAAGRPRIPQPA